MSLCYLAGYLTERSLFHYNLFLPNLRRQLFHEDLSIMPQPYRLMKNMLLTPGSLSGYTFYRVPQSREFGQCLPFSMQSLSVCLYVCLSLSVSVCLSLSLSLPPSPSLSLSMCVCARACL